RDVVRTVCEWVSSTIRTVIKVLEKVCSWLPWPLSELCNWVTKLVEVVQTVWNWVCHNVIDRIISWIEVVLEYIYYILKWVCWIIDWFSRGPELLICLLGFGPAKQINVCIKVLTNEEGKPIRSAEQIEIILRDAATILRRCNIKLVVVSNELVRKPEFLTATTCDFSGLFSDSFVWFSANACSCCSAITVYFVDTVAGADGCSYPATNWVKIASGGDGAVMVHEMGHLVDLTHSNDPNNVMYGTHDPTKGTHDQITKFQCCMFQTSHFASLVDQPLPIGITASASGAIVVEPLESPVERQATNLDEQTADMERLLGSRWFAVAKMVLVVASFAYIGIAIARWRSRASR
ncbi:MAG TPA: hypothetical protein VF844_23080, partial [Ktedonobacteraceae bacterium]